MKKKGFTLIEMLIVIIIIGILAATLIPRIGGARNRANDTARIADIRSLSTALIQYQLDNPTYPTATTDSNAVEDGSNCSLKDNTDLTKANYGLGGVIPADPVSSKHYTYNLLDSRKDHFVICAKLSDGSTAGNATSNLANTADCWNETANSYETTLGSLKSTGQYYCYVG